MGSECHHVSEIQIYLQHFSNKFDDFCVKLVFKVDDNFQWYDTFKDAVSGITRNDQNISGISRSKVTVLPVKVKGLECAGSKS
jgi:hypothetical protein